MASRKPLVVRSGGVETLQVSDRLNLGRLNLGPSTQLTVVSNAITVTGTVHSIFSVAPTTAERALRTITGGVDGDLLLLRGSTGSGIISVRDNEGNLRLSGDFAISSPQDFVALYCDGTFWYELATANNG